MTTAEELAQAERDNFLEWRRGLVELQEVDGITLTPFEKNLEFWRQLWRVIERRYNSFFFSFFIYKMCFIYNAQVLVCVCIYIFSILRSIC